MAKKRLLAKGYYIFGKSQWYLRIIAANGKEIARTSEVYKTKASALKVTRYFHPDIKWFPFNKFPVKTKLTGIVMK